MTSRSTRSKTAEMGTSRPVFALLSPNPALPSSLPEMRTYSRKRKRFESDQLKLDPTKTSIVSKNDIRDVPAQKGKKQTTISSFFKPPSPAQPPTPDSSPISTSPLTRRKTS